MTHLDQRNVQCRTTRGSQHLECCKVIYTTLSFVALALINSILNDTLQSLSASLAVITMNQHLLGKQPPLSQSLTLKSICFIGIVIFVKHLMRRKTRHCLGCTCFSNHARLSKVFAWLSSKLISKHYPLTPQDLCKYQPKSSHIFLHF